MLLLFLRRFVLSFFVPPILTVFYLIDLCDKEQKKERLRRRLMLSLYTSLESRPLVRKEGLVIHCLRMRLITQNLGDRHTIPFLGIRENLEQERH